MSNPLIEELSNSLPGVAISLPTQGIYYGKGVLAPNADVNEIEVGCLTMIDELKGRDPYLLASGQAMRGMVARLCPDVLDPDRLCDIDIEAILLAARIASYGDTLPIHTKCQNPERIELLDPDSGVPTGEFRPACILEEDLMISLTELMYNYAPITDRFEFVLLPYGQTVRLQPLTHKGSLALTRTLIDRQRELKLLEQYEQEGEVSLSDLGEDALIQYMRIVDTSINLTTDLIVDAIHTVTTSKGEVVSDKKVILEWLHRLPSDKVKELNEEINRLVDRLKQMSCVTHACPECGWVNKIPVILDAQKLFSSGAPDLTQTISSPMSEKSERKPTKRSRS